MKYYLGAAKTVVTGGQNVPFLFPAHLNHTIPLMFEEDMENLPPLKKRSGKTPRLVDYRYGYRMFNV